MATNYESEGPPPRWHKKTTQYGGVCERCGADLAEGDEVYMKPEVEPGGRKTWHIICSHHGEPAA